MIDGANLSLAGSLAVFCMAAAAVGLAGVRLSGLADRLADETRLGEALIGGVLLGATTSLSGVVTSVTAALEGQPELAVSNAAGGIAVQTAFLAVADVAYRRANLEHAAASAPNLIQATLLIGLLAIPLLAAATPDVTWAAIHPATPAILALYIFGLRLSSEARLYPMWRPTATDETVEDTPDEAEAEAARPLRRLPAVVLLALVIGGAGWLLAQSGLAISRHTGLSQTLIGAFLTAVATSMPELVTTVAAVSRKALTLAVAGIIGGNTFDVLFLVFSDVAYRGGSIYHAVSDRVGFLLLLTIVMTATLLLGLIRRERYGPGGIGFESMGILVLYLGGLAIQVAQF